MALPLPLVVAVAVPMRMLQLGTPSDGNGRVMTVTRCEIASVANPLSSGSGSPARSGGDEDWPGCRARRARPRRHAHEHRVQKGSYPQSNSLFLQQASTSQGFVESLSLRGLVLQ